MIDIKWHGSKYKWLITIHLLLVSGSDKRNQNMFVLITSNDVRNQRNVLYRLSNGSSFPDFYIAENLQVNLFTTTLQNSQR